MPVDFCTKYPENARTLKRANEYKTMTTAKTKTVNTNAVAITATKHGRVSTVEDKQVA